MEWREIEYIKDSRLPTVLTDEVTTPFIFISNSKKQRERVRKRITGRKLSTPKYRYNNNKKQTDLNDLLRKGQIILDTPSLLYTANEETAEIIKNNNFSMVIDDSFTLNQKAPITTLPTLSELRRYDIVDIHEDGTFSNTTENISGLYIDIQIMVSNGALTHRHGELYISSMPPILKGVFKEQIKCINAD